MKKFKAKVIYVKGKGKKTKVEIIQTPFKLIAIMKLIRKYRFLEVCDCNLKEV